MELFQSWQLLQSPLWELFKLLILLAFALAIGLLPYVDNWGNSEYWWLEERKLERVGLYDLVCRLLWACKDNTPFPLILSSLIFAIPHIPLEVGGLAFGVLSALVFLPYITFGRWDAVGGKE